MRNALRTRRLMLFLGLSLLVVAVPAVVAATGTFGSSLERQSAGWTSGDASTSSTAWRNVRGLSLARCTQDQVTATLSATVSGAPVRFRVLVDAVAEAPMRPGSARFAPDGEGSFSYTFVANTASFEADDTHRFTVQWRSPSGRTVKLENGALNLLYEQGTRGC